MATNAKIESILAHGDNAHVRRIVWLFLSLIAASLRLHAAERVDIAKLIDDPKPYHGKSVTVVGLVQIEANQIRLFENGLTPRGRDYRYSIVIRVIGRNPILEGSNHSWVRITGKMDAEANRRWSGAPGEMLLEKVEQIEPPKRETTSWGSRNDIGHFRNATEHTVRIGIISGKPGRSYSDGPFGPNEIARLEICTGKIHVLEDADRSKKLLVVPIIVPPRSSQYDPTQIRDFYYVIYRDRMVKEDMPNAVEPAKR